MRDRLTDALEQSVHPAPLNVPLEHVWHEGRRRRRRARLWKSVLGGLGLAGLIAGMAVVFAARDTSSTVRSGLFDANQSEQSVLSVPSDAGVRPDRLVDGTPVFVVRHENGGVDVVSATSTHAPHGLRQLVGWCAAIGAFDDGMYSSHWDEFGHKIGGPAPTDLPTFDIVSQTAHSVTVGALVPATRATRGTVARAGTACSTGPSPAFHGDGMAFPDLGTPLTISAALSEAPSGFVLIHDASIVRDNGEVHACDGDARDAATTCATVNVAGISQSVGPGLRRAVIRGDFIAKLRDSTLTDLVFVRGWTISPDGVSSETDSSTP